MLNPGIQTLNEFLTQVDNLAPVRFTELSEGRQRGYGMVSRYLKYCLGAGLIEVEKEERTRGRYPSKFYRLTSRGRKFLDILWLMEG